MESLEELKKKAEKAIQEPTIGASMTSLEEARNRKKKIDAAKKGVKDALKAAEQEKAPEPPKVPVVKELDELTSYKLLHLTEKRKNADQAVRQPIVMEYQRVFDAEVEKLKQALNNKLAPTILEALKKDQAFQAVEKEYADLINSVLERMAPELPEGYAVSKIDPEKKSIVAVWNPEAAGKKLNSPE